MFALFIATHTHSVSLFAHYSYSTWNVFIQYKFSCHTDSFAVAAAAAAFGGNNILCCGVLC